MAKVKLSRNEIICQALDKADAGLDTVIQDASCKEALEYLRLKVLTQAERVCYRVETLNFQTIIGQIGTWYDQTIHDVVQAPRSTTGIWELDGCTWIVRMVRQNNGIIWELVA